MRLPVGLVALVAIGLARRVEASGDPRPGADGAAGGEALAVGSLDRVAAEPGAGDVAAQRLRLDVLVGVLGHDREGAEYAVEKIEAVGGQIDGDFVFAGDLVGTLVAENARKVACICEP